MKKILFGCMLAIGLASCSNDEVILEQNDANKINFAVTTMGNTRAKDVFCNNNKPGEFSVYATVGGATFINGDLIKNEGGKWENKSGNRYWPDSKVDFYAHVNGGTNFQWNNDKPKFENFTVDNTVAEQLDLLYAVKTQQEKSTSPVTLNFHHALSQVVFYAKNKNPNLYVEITGVSVCNVKNNGTYTLPNTDTDANVAHGAKTDTPDGGQGSWAFGETTDSYSVTFDAVKLVGDKDAPVVHNLTDNTNLAADSFGHGEGEENAFGNAMILMPQGSFDALEIAEKTKFDEATAEGVYFKLQCTIYNVADPEAEDLTQNIKFWDNKDIIIPVSGEWKEGMKYIYTFVFGEGDGGWDPTDPDDPKPVLVPITFDVTVDEFIPVVNDDLDAWMQTKDPEEGGDDNATELQ